MFYLLFHDRNFLEYTSSLQLTHHGIRFFDTAEISRHSQRGGLKEV